jgi:CMP-N,N'-diacetyllegionaminic acid synthase
MRRTLGIIPARGGSKGIPRKNIRPLVGKPLIGWSIEAAIKSHCCQRLIVSTDDESIAAISREFEADVPFIRPASVSSDTATSLSVVEHALDWLAQNEGEKYTHILLLQPTSPLRTFEDIINSDRLSKDKDAAIVSVCEPHDHPYLARIIRPDGILEPIIPDAANYTRRQDFPRVFILNGAIYLCSVECLLHENTLVPKRTLPYIMPRERSFDIDTPWDFFLVEKIMQEKILQRI